MADSASRAGVVYASEAIVDYVNRIHAAHDTALARAFAVPESMPAIQVGPSEGKLLWLLLRLLGARKVVEVGTLAGYSAIHIARALSPGGQLWSIEVDTAHAEVARGNITAAGLSDVVSVVVGPAREMLPTLECHGPFDAVFIDADKPAYEHYGRWAIAHLRTGGLVIGDNAYLFSELLEDTEPGRAMRSFHAHVAAACDSVCVPTPDGMVVGIKR